MTVVNNCQQMLTHPMCYNNNKLHTLKSDTEYTDYTDLCKFDFILFKQFHPQVCRKNIKGKTKIAYLAIIV